MTDQDKTKVQLIDELETMRQRVTELEQVETQYKGTLESLEQSGRTYYDLYDNAPDMFVFVDAKTANIIRCNQTVVQTLGYPREEIIGRSIFERYHPDCIEKAHEVFQAFVETGEVHDAELVLKREDGSKIDVSLNVSSVRDEEGNVLYGRSVWRNITRHKRAEKALRRSETRYRTLFGESRDAVYMNTREGKILDVNQAGLDLLGYPRDELIGMNVRRLYVHPEERSVFQREIEQKGSVRDYELKFRRKDGVQIDCLVTSTVRRAVDGTVLGYQGIIRDITEQMKAENALHESEQRFRQLAENLREVFWLSSLDGRQIYFINPAYEEIWGRSRESLIAQPEPWLDAVHPEDREEVLVNFEKQSRGEFVEYEYRIVRPDGEIRWVEAHVFPVRNEEGQIYRCAGSAQEITKRKRAEELAESQQQQLIQADKMASLGILVSGVAHEINNPNNFIMLNGEILSMAWQNVMPILQKYYEENGDFLLAGMPYTRAHEKIDQLISGISEGAARIGKIVETLGGFARQDAGDLNQQVDPNAVVESAMVIVNNLIKKSTHHPSVELGENLPKIRGNPQQLEQVIINLITNSCQALQSPQKRLFVSTSYNKQSDLITIRVRDEGEGIPPENLNHIIEPFFTTKRDTGGTGLGLSMSYNIVKNHGGHLHFTSRFGKGTTATVMLPVSRRSMLD
jgi:PAS domain S-box-containing protein